MRNFARVIAGEDEPTMQGLKGDMQECMAQALGKIQSMLKDISRPEKDYRSAGQRGRANAEDTSFNCGGKGPGL